MRKPGSHSVTTTGWGREMNDAINWIERIARAIATVLG
jgi:hypothetical protein